MTAVENKASKQGKTKKTIGTILGTGFFAILCAIIIFPVFAGLLASFAVQGISEAHDRHGRKWFLGAMRSQGNA